MSWVTKTETQRSTEIAFDGYSDPETGWSLNDVDRLERLRDFLTKAQTNPTQPKRAVLSISPQPKGNGKHVEHVAYIGDRYKNETLYLCTIQGAEHIAHTQRASKDDTANIVPISAPLRNDTHATHAEKLVSLLRKLGGKGAGDIKYSLGNVWIEVGNDFANQCSNSVIISRVALEAIVTKINEIIQWRDEARQALQMSTSDQEPLDYRQEVFTLLKQSTINVAIKAKEQNLVGINGDDLDGLAFFERVKGISNVRGLS